MMKRKMLFLGGIMQQIPAIVQAKNLGYHVVTCDYLPGNPGHRFSDEYHNVSTTDLDGVLSLAQRLRIDGIVAYASDPAAPTAAYVAEKMGLPGNPYESVKLLTEKDLFRDFLKTHGFNSPVAGGYKTYEAALADIGRFKFPVMVKPVDSSGSKGVVKVYDVAGLKSAVDEALSYSRGKRFIVEEFIVKKGYQISGDGFSVDGKLVFTSFGNELYSGKGTREYVALGEFWPSLLTQKQKDKVDAELQRLITALGMRTCAYNIEVILDKDDNVFVLELGPRNGGSYIPQLIKYATGVDLVEATLKAAMGDELPHLEMTPTQGVFSNYMIYSTVSGRFREIAFDSTFERDNLLEVHCTASHGDMVYAYQNTAHSLGTIIFKAKTVEEMISITNNIDQFYKVVVDGAI
jgi:biotin carboxylase